MKRTANTFSTLFLLLVSLMPGSARIQMWGLLLFSLAIGVGLGQEAQGQVPQRVITKCEGCGFTDVYAADLTGNDIPDVLSVSASDEKIAWYKNNGDGTFSAQKVIATDVGNFITSVYPADLTGSGAADVLAATIDKIVWYKNNGDGTFSDQKVINSLGAQSVHAARLSYGGVDILLGGDAAVAWYENLGGGAFSSQQVITPRIVVGTFIVHAADLTGNGTPDVLSASENDGEIVWYENIGSSFSDSEVITTNAGEDLSVHAADLTGNGDSDVLSASDADNKIAWYENNGNGTFSDQKVITTSAAYARSVYPADLTDSGDPDVLSASSDKIVWYKNNGDGTLSTQKVISTNVEYPRSVYAADLTRNGNPDVLSASSDKIAWYENTPGTFGDDDRTIHQARTALRNGTAEEVILEGTVSRAYGSYARLQDESGPTGASAILLRQTAGSNSADFQQDITDDNIRSGTSLRVQGTLSHFNGLIQINNSDLTSYSVMGQGDPPEMQEVTLSDLESNGEDYESELVRITGLSFPSASGTFNNDANYDVVDGTESNPVVLRVQGKDETTLGGESIPAGTFTFEDVVGQFNSGGGVTDDTGYQLIGIFPRTALPVELASFRATQTNKAAELIWTTTSETNNAGFAVERRADSTATWQALGFVESKADGGTTAEARQYRFETGELEVGTHQFRLKQIDTDGSARYSRTVEASVRVQEAYRLSTYPNPVRQQATVKIAAREKQRVTLRLYDLLGRQVATLHDGPLPAQETKTISLQTGPLGLTSGTYFLQLQAGERTKMERLTVVR
jgi:hypothetical protein